MMRPMNVADFYAIVMALLLCFALGACLDDQIARRER